MFFSRGISTCSVDFEIEEIPFHQINDRFFTCTVSLMQASGSGH